MLKNEVILEFTGIEYHQHGVRHRTYGPAYLETFGYHSYWQYGVLHRRDGSALVSSWDDDSDYWIRGKEQC